MHSVHEEDEDNWLHRYIAPATVANHVNSYSSKGWEGPFRLSWGVSVYNMQRNLRGIAWIRNPKSKAPRCTLHCQANARKNIPLRQPRNPNRERGAFGGIFDEDQGG